MALEGSEVRGASVGSPELVARARRHAGRIALAHAAGEHAYEELLAASEAVARRLLEHGGGPDLRESPVTFMAAPGLEYVAALWGIWRAGGIAVPLCTFHPPPELAYVLEDTAAGLVLADGGSAPAVEGVAEAAGARLLRLGAPDAGASAPAAGEVAGSAFGRIAGSAAQPTAGPDAGEAEGTPAERKEAPSGDLPRIAPERRALILYTSGTTSRPKGVVHTHGSVQAQVESLVGAWAWNGEDRILHVLPLHHTHGIVNALLCPLWAGATCEMLPAFDAEAVWRRLVEGTGGRRPALTVFMAVPTIYAKLIAAWEAASPEERERRSRAAAALRLMVSGSAALPVRVFERWREITGHALLERYGMTEIGMALSNPLEGERRSGTVGQPLPGVELRLVDESGRPLPGGADRAGADPAAGRAAGGGGGGGEIEVRGAAVFREYWRRPEETREAFREGWFRTGDVAVLERGYYRILGRRSVDILKSGGYKISALEIEEVLREHPGVADCAVVGLPDPEWGEVVAAAVVPVAGDEAAGVSAGGPDAADLLASLDGWARERLASYKVPRRWRLVEELPRNAMGKVTKPEVRGLFGSQGPGEPR